jgi:type I restriction-modification system DNA methylase subunit
MPRGRRPAKEADQRGRDVPGFRRSATLEEVRQHGHVLTPGRYVGAEAQEDDLPAPGLRQAGRRQPEGVGLRWVG